MNDYISKPVRPQALAKVLEKWLMTLPGNDTQSSDDIAEDRISSLTVFDREALLNKLMDDEELLQTVIATFLEDLPKQLLRSAEFPEFNAIPILVVSATFSGEETTRITADLGANAFLPSPVDFRRFIETVRSLLKKDELPQDPLRVLIVEDSRTLAGMLKKKFKQNGYQADVASNLASALRIIDKEVFDVAVIDYHLPDGKGDKLLTRFKNFQPDLASIMMTTDPGPKLAFSWMQAGAAAYVHKPFDLDYLIELCSRTRRERSLLRIEALLEMRTQELQESEARWQFALEGAGDGVWDWNIITNRVYFSRQWKEMLGYDISEIGETFDEWDSRVHPDDKVSTYAELDRHHRGEVSVYKDAHRILCKNGSYKWILTRGKVIEWTEEGKPLRMIGTHSDISDQKEKEAEREHLISELKDALAEVKTLSGLLPICSFCKKIRDDKGYWNQLESYIRDHSEAEFSHSICRDCAKKHYPDFDFHED